MQGEVDCKPSGATSNCEPCNGLICPSNETADISRPLDGDSGKDKLGKVLNNTGRQFVNVQVITWKSP